MRNIWLEFLVQAGQTLRGKWMRRLIQEKAEANATESTGEKIRHASPRLARLTSHVPPGQFLRYLMVGVWNTFFGYGTYALFTALLMPRVRFGYVYAAVFSSLLNITIAYFGYKFFVFKTHGNYLLEWFRCILVYGSGMLPGLVLLPLLVEGLHYGFHLQGSAPYIAGALVMGMTVMYSFLGHRHFTFRVPADAAREAAMHSQQSMSAAPLGVIEEEAKRS